ncbi:MAG: zinc-dependent metalloprotease [Chitinophagaceae bacterium]|nr:zinc-dependent metalloprotease [Chitinophagaceae bacterium]MCW5927545.1 zinc-dependent metalloprotease [Chitinophagaceae bacterium]
MKQLFRILFILLSAGTIHTTASGQAICGFDDNYRFFRQAFPEAQKIQQETEKRLSQWQQSKMIHPQKQPRIYQIPVVVHVLHTGDTIGSRYNPEDSRIIAAINYLNDIFSGAHSSLTPAGEDAAGDIGIRFVFAKRDPECNPTNGIHRVNMKENTNYLTQGALNQDIDYDMALKTPISWDVSRYYNIYVVNKINGNDGSAGQYVAGFAYFPVNSMLDGTVILASAMRAGSKTLVHEIGHAFNLYHPFEGSADADWCPLGDGDYVDDTDPISMNAIGGLINFECRTGANPCNDNRPYSIRTEHNFMNYTSCYTLFTPGQKDRMNACLLLSERASLVTSTALLPTYDGNGQACDPKINFETDEVRLPELQMQQSGCREFKDFTFYFTIGNSPSVNTTVALSVDPSSAAGEQTDFDFIGGKNIEFPAGILQKRPFTIRVYDVGQREAAKKLVLNFTVNNHGGNAGKGTAIPRMNIWLRPNNEMPVVQESPFFAALGNGNRYIDDAYAFNASLRHQKSVIQYNREELLGAGLKPGNIVAMSFFLVKNSRRPFKDIRIKLKHSTAQALIKDGDIMASGAAQEVLSMASYTTTDGWNTFTFNTPFNWNGTDNICAELCFDNGSEDDTEANDFMLVYSDGSSAELSNMLTSTLSCTAPLHSFSSYSDGIKPSIRFTQITDGNPVASTRITSEAKYLGPYAEVYFYDNSSPQRIIAAIKNLTDQDYGCTSIEIDREGVRAFPLWNFNPAEFIMEKTFRVVPQYPAANGRYEISLYYTAKEKEGYEQLTGNDWQHVQLMRTNGVAVSAINLINQQRPNTEFKTGVLRDAFGNDYVIKATIDAGLGNLSGFSAGIVTATLPLNWIDFTATDKNGYVALSWTTENESNTSHFEVEYSTDGTVFHMLGRVASTNIPGINEYSFDHMDPAEAGTIFYRIRQVDIDQRSSYSKTIRLQVTGSSGKPVVFPVPARGMLTIDLKKQLNDVTIRILASDSRPVYTERLPPAVAKHPIDISRLPAGAYLIQVISPEHNHTLRFIKY